MQEQSTNLCDTKYKIVFLGNMGAKPQSSNASSKMTSINPATYLSPLITAHCRNRLSYQEHLLPRQQKFYSIDKTYRLQLWDTAGQEKYKSLVPAYLRDANCAVFVFDFTKKQTFHDLTNWIQLYRDHASQLSVAFLIGNKSDLTEFQQAYQSTTPEQQLQDEATKFAKRQNMVFQKVSAKTGKDVMSSFENMIIQLQRGNKKKQNPAINVAEQEFEKQVLEKMDKLRLGAEKQGMHKASCCYI